MEKDIKWKQESMNMFGKQYQFARLTAWYGEPDKTYTFSGITINSQDWNNEIDIITIVKKILEIMNKPQDLIEFVEDRPGHDQRYSMNSTKISKNLGWATQTKFEDGLEKTVSWYMENPQIWKNLDSNIFESTPWKVSN